MEIIRKKICLDRYRSKRQGLLPYIPYNVNVSGRTSVFNEVTEDDYNGNFGGFVCDVDGDSSSYCSEMYKYNKIINELYKGKKLFKTGDYWVEKYDSTKNIYDYDSVVSMSGFTMCSANIYKTDATISGNTAIGVNDESILSLSGDIKTFCKKIDKYIGRIMVPTSISGGYVTESISLVDVPAMKEELNALKPQTDCCSVKRYKMLGGDAMLTFLNTIDFDEYKPSVTPEVPYITVPVMITSKFDDLGVMKTHEYEATLISDSVDTYTTNLSGITESKLGRFRTQRYYYDDEGNVLPGLFVEKTSPAYYKWICSGAVGEWIILGGVPSSDVSQCEVYTISASLPKDNGTDSIVSNYASVMYTNDAANPMTIPYKAKVPFNIIGTGRYIGLFEVMIGDFINEINITDNTIEFIYTIGGEYYINTAYDPDVFTIVEETGVKYREIYPYYSGQTMTVSLDGTSDVTIYYNKIDFDAKKETVKHISLNVEREINVAEVIAHNTDWPFCAENEAYDDAPIYKEDFMMPSTFDYRTNVDIEVSRGNAGAFEKHLKLCECNTMQDLKNYTNNYFNL